MFRDRISAIYKGNDTNFPNLGQVQTFRGFDDIEFGLWHPTNLYFSENILVGEHWKSVPIARKRRTREKKSYGLFSWLYFLMWQGPTCGARCTASDVHLYWNPYCKCNTNRSRAAGRSIPGSGNILVKKIRNSFSRACDVKRLPGHLPSVVLVISFRKSIGLWGVRGRIRCRQFVWSCRHISILRN